MHFSGGKTLSVGSRVILTPSTIPDEKDESGWGCDRELSWKLKLFVDHLFSSLCS